MPIVDAGIARGLLSAGEARALRRVIRLAPRGDLVRSALTARVNLRVAVLRLRRLCLKTSLCVARPHHGAPCRTWESDRLLQLISHSTQRRRIGASDTLNQPLIFGMQKM